MILAYTVLLALVCLGGAANAEDCGPLKQIASLDMTAGPGAPGCWCRSPSTASRNRWCWPPPAASQPPPGRRICDEPSSIDASHIKLLSGNGTASQDYVQVDFRMGNVRDPDLQVMVLPVQGGGPPPFAGALAGDFLSLYDVEMDFAGRKLNFFSKDHCPGHVLYWNRPQLRWFRSPCRYRPETIPAPVSGDIPIAASTSTCRCRSTVRASRRRWTQPRPRPA